jgi:hypothetical protein
VVAVAVALLGYVGVIVVGLRAPSGGYNPPALS